MVNFRNFLTQNNPLKRVKAPKKGVFTRVLKHSANAHLLPNNAAKAVSAQLLEEMNSFLTAERDLTLFIFEAAEKAKSIKALKAADAAVELRITSDPEAIKILKSEALEHAKAVKLAQMNLEKIVEEKKGSIKDFRKAITNLFLEIKKKVLRLKSIEPIMPFPELENIEKSILSFLTEANREDIIAKITLSIPKFGFAEGFDGKTIK